MQALTGRERQHDLEITIGSTVYPFKVARMKGGRYVSENDHEGVPVWSISRVADIAGQSASVQDQPRSYNSFHSGYGWSQYKAPNTYHKAINMDFRFAGQGIMGPLVTTVTLATTDATNGVGVIFEIPTITKYVYVIAGKFANRIDTTDDSLATSPWPYTLASGFVATGCANWDGFVLIATSGTGTMYKFNGTTFTQAGDTTEDNLKGEYFAPFFGTTTLVLAQNFLSGSNPATAWLSQGADAFTPANWSGNDGSYSIGDQSGTVTGMAGVDRTLFVAKTDGLYFIDGQTGKGRLIIPAMPVASTNGKNTLADSAGRIWYPTKSGLYMYDSSTGTIDDVSPGRGLPDRTGIKGQVTALAQFRSWTYATIYDGTDTYLMAGRPREENEPGYGSYIWHGYLAKWSSMKITYMFLSAKSDPPRLWFGQSDGSVSYIKLPSNGDNPLNDTSYRYTSTGGIYLAADDFGMGGMRWNLSDVIYEAYGLQPDQGTPDQIVSVTPYERRDATPTNYSSDNGWTALASAGTTDGRVLITPTGDKRFNRAEIRLDVANGVTGGTTTPVIRAVAARAASRPTQRDVIKTTVILSDELISRMGIPGRLTAQDLLDQLDTLDSYFPVAIKTYWTGSAATETVLVMPIDKRVIKQDDDKAVVLAVDLVMKVVS